MLAFVMLWAYTAFSEYLLIWYANLKEEIPHFLVRQLGVWGFVAALLIVFHFFLPFMMLLVRDIKDRANTIATVAVILLVMRYVNVYWLAAPSWNEGHFHYSWMNPAALIGIGGLWLYVFIDQLKGQTIIPIHETWVEEAMREGVLKVNA
jgi:NhaP-type Na+/H+ or K+/H+ antiporter